MSALTILYLVLPFPFLFVLHEAEEVVVQHRWMRKHEESLKARFPWLRSVIIHLSSLNTKAFALAASEELLLVLGLTCYVLVDGLYAQCLWAAVMMAFSFHLMIHVIQAVAVKGYVPGLITSLLLLPYAAYCLWSIWLVMDGPEMATLGLMGVLFMVVNLRMAHWLGRRLTE